MIAVWMTTGATNVAGRHGVQQLREMIGDSCRELIKMYGLPEGEENADADMDDLVEFFSSLAALLDEHIVRLSKQTVEDVKSEKINEV